MADNNKSTGRKDRILDAALQIFAEKGFLNSTIVEISKEAGVSEATVYEYFGTKEDLLFAIPEKISNEGFDEMSRVLPYIKGVEGRLRAILYAYVHLYHSNPHYSALVLLQLTSNKRFRQAAAHAAIRRSAHTLLDCIRAGIADGTFKKDLNAYLVRSMLLGTIEHLFIHWHMQGMRSRGPGIEELLDPFIDMILEGIRSKREEPAVTLHLNLADAQSLNEAIRKKTDLNKPAGAKKSGKTLKRKNPHAK